MNAKINKLGNRKTSTIEKQQVNIKNMQKERVSFFWGQSEKKV